MDKLKKVLSGQDTEDRSGLSEVSAALAVRIPWTAALLPSHSRRRAQPGQCHRWQRGDFAEGVAPDPFPTSPREDRGSGARLEKSLRVEVWVPGPPGSLDLKPSSFPRHCSWTGQGSPFGAGRGWRPWWKEPLLDHRLAGLGCGV